MCCEEIAAAAKKCPHCHHWQHWLSTSIVHPVFGVLFFIVPLAILWLMGIVLLGNVFRKGEPFQNHTGQVTITESRMEFGQDHCGPTVAVVGKMKNSSEIDWRNLCFQVEFFDAKGSLVDAVQKKDDYTFTRLLPAGQELGFQVSFPRQFPEKNEELRTPQDSHSLRGGQYAEVPNLRLIAYVSGVYRTRNCDVVGAGDYRPSVGEDR
jgi:hypothetical protein